MDNVGGWNESWPSDVVDTVDKYEGEGDDKDEGPEEEVVEEGIVCAIQ